MPGINLKHSLATVAVVAGLLVPAVSASAEAHPSGLVLYNGHAGLGVSVTDGTSNTIAFGERNAGLDRAGSHDALSGNGRGARVAAGGNRR